jgi:hypothetical protein
MALSEFNRHGDLPEGIHPATLSEVLQRFGAGSAARRAATGALQRIYDLAIATGKLERFVVFGSYVTDKMEPGDVDVVLMMKDDFSLSECDDDARAIFDHQRAQAEIGASIFWAVPSAIIRSSLDDFLLGWGTKRDQTSRGIVEVIR